MEKSFSLKNAQHNYSKYMAKDCNNNSYYYSYHQTTLKYLYI